MDLASLSARLTPLEQAGATAELVREGMRLLAVIPAGSLEEAYLTYQVGKAQTVLSAWQEALPLLRRAVRLRPDLAHAHYLLGTCFAGSKQWPAALEAHRRSCGLDPGFAEGWFEQGRAAFELGDLRQALACFRQAERLDPVSAWARSQRVRTEVRLALAAGNLDQVVALIHQELLQQLPQSLVLQEWITLVCDWILVGDLAGSWSLSQALAIDGGSVEACSLPLPRRPALVLQVVIGLLDPIRFQEAQAAAPRLQELLWMSSTAVEAALWSGGLQSVLGMLLGRLAAAAGLASAKGAACVPPQQQPVLRVLLQALAAMAPSEARSSALGRDLSALEPADRWHRAAADALAEPLAALAPPPAGAIDAPFVQAAARLALAQHDLEAFLPKLEPVWVEGGTLLRRRPSDARPRRWLDLSLWWLNNLAMQRPTRLLVQPGRLPEALALRERGLQQLLSGSTGFTQLDGQRPAPLASRSRGHWLLVANDDLPQCFLYRVEQKRQQLESLGCCVEILLRDELMGWGWSERLLWADAVVVCRMPASYPVLRFLGQARRFGVPIYYDIDDLVFDAEHCPPPLATYGGTIDPVMHRSFSLDVPLFRVAMEQADGLIFSTRTLATRWLAISQSSQQVMVLPNLAPPELLRQARPPRTRREGALRLVFASGTKAHKQVWKEELAPALAAVMAANPSVRLDLLGHVDLPDVLLTHASRIRAVPYSSYDRYLQQLGQADIGLVVLEPGVFTDGKSAIRWMELSLMGVAAILSPTATYRELVEEGEHALYARGHRQWVEAIQSLLQDPERRTAMAERAHHHAQACFGLHQAAPFWQPLIANPQPPATRRRRLLVINVFFSPQSVGGATRVAQDQVQAVLERAGDRYDVTVLCVDKEPWQEFSPSAQGDLGALPLDVHDWHGTRVVRLGLPPKPWSWHHDGEVERFCRWWFAREGFDLIHAHCLQVLTAAPLRIAADLGIPYLVTLHDAWWLSPLQFLTTPDGQPVDPADPLGHEPAGASRDPLAVEKAIERSNDLADVLAGASARLAVSESFANLYRQAGIAAVEVLENDWTPMATLSRPRRRSDAPLRLCHVGGMAVHKGFAVLRAAVLQLPQPGLELTVVDHSLEEGAEGYTTHWNTTPVRFVPPVSMGAMASFYAQQDVLVAPSIWPESYGLVTREALSAGLWVIASAIGALADPIEDGVNGNRVPPGDPRALAAVLGDLQKNGRLPLKPAGSSAADARGALAGAAMANGAIETLLQYYNRSS
ncbi:glycosyltransferase [Synechococcus sp. CS-1328]|uniref:glycosyltransferase n=1 Tax=Synechococcus sp. CS-1328 TaxID=2847976 RepID=UPI00223B35F1|nr:glycosyltransferase [Synechococcus sp. CS-1328]MCT0225745.1 glycosyltransferase [Synechococcus sp. CS-1328]